MLKHALGMVFAGILGLVADAQQSPSTQNCLHGQSETAAQAARRQAALQLARQINTTEAQAFVMASCQRSSACAYSGCVAPGFCSRAK